MNNIFDVTEATQQFVVRVFAVVIAVVILSGFAVLLYIIVHDGNAPLVSQTIQNVTWVVLGGFATLFGVVIGKPLATGFMAKAANSWPTISTTPPNPPPVSYPTSAPLNPALTTPTPLLGDSYNQQRNTSAPPVSSIINAPGATSLRLALSKAITQVS